VENAPKTRHAALAFIFVTVCLDVLAFGIIIPVLPALVKQMMGGDTAHAARIYGFFGVVWWAMQLVGSPVMGALSDRFGRRPVILLSCLGLGLDYIVMALAPGVALLFVGRIVSGLMAASFSTAGAYVADVTPPEKRAAAFGVLGAAWGFGFVVGPALGGALAHFNPRLPFWGAATLALASALYGLFVLPESLPRERRTPFSWRRANPFGSLVLLRSTPELLLMGGIYLLFAFAHHVLPSVFVLYAGHRYGWGELGTSTALALVGVCNAAVQGGLVRRFVPRFGERSAITLGLLCGALGFAAFGLAPSGGLFLIAMPLVSLMGLFTPGIQALMTRQVPPTAQGRLQGANGSMMGLTGLAAPLLFSFTFAHFIAPDRPVQHPGAPFFLAAAIMVVALAVALTAVRPEALGQQPTTQAGSRL
jgi:MFS transporter, DHA1 family, tetracycline resistance protein